MPNRQFAHAPVMTISSKDEYEAAVRRIAELSHVMRESVNELEKAALGEAVAAYDVEYRDEESGSPSENRGLG